jgi:anthranilate phosphoribosyltransferase
VFTAQRTTSLPSALSWLLEGKELPADVMREVMRAIMRGEATPAQIGGFLIGLRAKGESVAEVVAAAEVLREMSVKVPVAADHLIDTCGTGGDGAHTFNISTAAAFVVAAAGGRVAKHGGRSVSSRTGSADVLEAAGVNLDLTPEQVRACIEQVGVGFMFAQHHHGAMKHAVGPRRELGVRTIFNLLGPLTNPAGAPNQLVGVFAEAWVVPLAEALRELGSRHVLVVHADDGLDEISIAGPTQIAELRDGRIAAFTVAPEQFGMTRAPLGGLVVETAVESLAMIRRIYEGTAGPARDVVVLNAGAALYASGLCDSLEAGAVLASSAIDNGAAGRKLEDLVAFTRSF